MRSFVSVERLILAVIVWAQSGLADVSTADLEIPTVAPVAFDSQRAPCPASCDGQDPAAWTVYSGFDRLKACNQPILFDFSIYNDVDDPGVLQKVRACTTGDSGDKTNGAFEMTGAAKPSPSKRNETVAGKCIAAATSSKISLKLSWNGSQSNNADNIVTAYREVQKFALANCDSKFVFGYYRGAVAGLYAGSSIDKLSLSATIDGIVSEIQKRSKPPVMLITQLCTAGRNADHVLGLASSATGDLASIQQAVRSWYEAQCLETSADSDMLSDIDILEDVTGGVLVSSNSTALNLTVRFRAPAHVLSARGDCTTASVVSGDSCASLASKCGISANDFTKYNPASNLCSTLMPGQRVCCSAGTLPDIKPKPYSNGTCFTYFVQPGDTCSALAGQNGLTVLLIERYNNGTNGTWGWNGCNSLNYGMNICLSTGTPPMPAPISNSLCGPTKPGTAVSSNLTSLNPCPLNVCCNIWGQCGIDSDFCVEKRGPSGNPGTSPPGTNGCVMNCGMDIIQSSAPASYGRVGYYESWNMDRVCLRMKAADANTLGYSHMHWAFGTLTSEFKPVINDTYKQWSDFKNLGSQSVKRIISFGGWGYSTDPATYEMLRTATNPTNRAAFANNIISFLNSEGLDGVDFDWEYPSEPDIPGIPAGDIEEGQNYLKFLTTIYPLAQKAGKSVSIAAPASYWYLRAFPIAQMSRFLDYIVYMTYDLHGQWDAGNAWSSPGCQEGNCLRSHINLTETELVLAMITKAGVPSNKIFVGEASYGRSFAMSDGNCDGPSCHFTGTNTSSLAEKGRCTDTAGYISLAEINDFLISDAAKKSYYDDVSGSDIMVWDDTQWVAYMSGNTRQWRRDHWQGMNFAGTIDWAVDLQGDIYGSYSPDPDEDTTALDIDGDQSDGVADPPCLDDTIDTLEDLDGKLDGMSEHCRAQYTLQTLRKVLADSLSQYDTLVRDGYQDAFNTYADAVVSSAAKGVRDFYMNNGNKYFSCIMIEAYTCCSECNKSCGTSCAVNCRYCEDWQCVADDCSPAGCHGQGCGGSCNPEFRYKNVSEPCPPDYSLIGSAAHTESIYWDLLPDKENVFYNDLASTVGITKDNIGWGMTSIPCAPSDEGTVACWAYNWMWGIPQPQGYDRSDIPDPSDDIKKGRANLDALGPQLDQVIGEMRGQNYFDQGWEMVDAVSLPIVMAAEAIDGMQQVIETAKEINDANAKNFILMFLTALFLFIPVAGEVVGALTGAAAITRILTMVSIGAEAGMDIYSIVSDPDHALGAIFSLVLTPLAIGDVVAVEKAAAARRGLRWDDVGALGTKVKSRMETVRKSCGKCMTGE